jgi:hypothetical protein
MKLWSGELSDDSGFLGLVDPSTYDPEIGQPVNYENTIAHVKTQMESRRLLLWATGMENIWRIVVTSAKVPESVDSYRQISGPITVASNRLCLVNYESLTRAGKPPIEPLPLRHFEYACFRVSPGLYNCSVFQITDPKTYSDNATDFRIELTKTGAQLPPWSEIAWQNQ